MKAASTFLLLIFSISSYGQDKKLTDDQYNKSGARKLMFVNSMTEVKDLALLDISNKTPFLLLQSGEAPIIYTTDGAFEEYNITYFDFGCLPPSLPFIIEYNKVIFKFLNQKYGKKWMKDVRDDVLGLKEFKRNKL